MQGSGNILGTSSGLGHVTALVLDYYASSKWAFETLHESLAAEVALFGTKVTTIEPGAYVTEFGSSESLRFAATLKGYAYFKKPFFAGPESMKRSDPAATPAFLFAIVYAAQLPMRLFLGSHNLLCEVVE